MRRSKSYTSFLVMSLTLLTSATVFAHTKKEDAKYMDSSNIVSGKITSAEGDALKGASVRNINSNEYILTNEDGFYKIKGNREDLIEFSYLGLTSDTLTITKAETRDVILYKAEDSEIKKKQNQKQNKKNWFGGAGVSLNSSL